MDLHLKGKVAVITGGGSGIGRAAALEFAREGCRVAICGRTPEKLEETRAQVEALGAPALAYCADVAHAGGMSAFADAVAQQLGGIDIWVNNAGINRYQPILDYTEEDWDTIMDTNLKAVFFCSQIAARHMIGNRSGGVIVNVSSYAALIPHVDRAIYAAAKCGVESLTKTFAAALAPHGIRVVSVIPGMIKTELSAKTHTDPELFAKSVRDISLQRLGEPEDLAKPLVFLSSGACGYITGSHLEVSGGKFSVQDPAKSWK